VRTPPSPGKGQPRPCHLVVVGVDEEVGQRPAPHLLHPRSANVFLHQAHDFLGLPTRLDLLPRRCLVRSCPLPHLQRFTGSAGGGLQLVLLR